jgi:hypothetical protein
MSIVPGGQNPMELQFGPGCGGVHKQYYAATVVTFEQFLFAAKSTLGAAPGQTTYAKHSQCRHYSDERVARNARAPWS